jgi:hypothetical protein
MFEKRRRGYAAVGYTILDDQGLLNRQQFH